MNSSRLLIFCVMLEWQDFRYTAATKFAHPQHLERCERSHQGFVTSGMGSQLAFAAAA
ncbi:MAG: hypothetical protein WBB25_07010 [Sulfitobacter sp.]